MRTGVFIDNSGLIELPIKSGMYCLYCPILGFFLHNNSILHGPVFFLRDGVESRFGGSIQHEIISWDFSSAHKTISASTLPESILKNKRSQGSYLSEKKWKKQYPQLAIYKKTIHDFMQNERLLDMIPYFNIPSPE